MKTCVIIWNDDTKEILSCSLSELLKRYNWDALKSCTQIEIPETRKQFIEIFNCFSDGWKYTGENPIDAFHKAFKKNETYSDRYWNIFKKMALAFYNDDDVNNIFDLWEELD